MIKGSGDYCDVTSRTQQSILHHFRTVYLFMFGRLDPYWSQIAEICRKDVS